MPVQQQQAPQITPGQLNQLARLAVTKGTYTADGRKLGPAIKRTYQISGGGTFVPANTPQITIVPQNVGLLAGFWVQVVTTVSNGSAVPINLTDLGPANSLANIQFQDLQNNTRVQCPGWTMAFSNSVRNHGQSFGSAILRGSGSDTPINWGSNFSGQISAPSQIAAGGTGTVTMWYWVPIAYSDEDLRGVIYINVLNATGQLILSFPGNGGLTGQNGVTLCAANGTDTTQAMYAGAQAGSITAVTSTGTTINCFQVFWDSIPVHPQYGLMVPQIDAATVYEIKQTALTGLVVGQDFPYQYPNYRDVIATYAIYNNNPGNSTGRVGGTDANYWQLLTANFTAMWKKTPPLVALETRNLIGNDMPPGCYYFNTRLKPISTTQYGNMQLIINPSLVGASNAYLLVAIEDFAPQAALSIAGSLAAN